MKNFRHYTPQEYLDWVKEETDRKMRTGLYKSPIKPLFKVEEEDKVEDPEWWIFDEENWNGGDILRHLLVNHPNRLVPSIIWFYYICDGQTYIFLFKENSFYEISWYKDRGRTEKILMNGSPITLLDYINLYNELLYAWEEE